MTLHTIRGSTGIMKELYDFHANVMSSSDMAIFLLTGNNCYGQVQKIQEKKRDALAKMKATLIGFLAETDKTDIIANAYLLETWLDFLEFHEGIIEHTEVVVKEPRIDTLNCHHIEYKDETNLGF